MDEKEEESDDQKEEQWTPCPPSNESNSLTHTLFDCPPCLPKEDECYTDKCDAPMAHYEIPMIDELNIC